MRTDTNSLLSISTPSTAKKAPFNRVPERNGAAFSDDFSRAQEAFSPKKEIHSRTSKADEPRPRSTSHQPDAEADSNRIQNKDKQQTSSEMATQNAKKDGQQTLSSSSQSASNVRENTTKGEEVTELEKDNSGKKLQASGEASPKQTPTEGQETVKHIASEVAGAGVVAKAAQQAIADSTQSDSLTPAVGTLSEDDAVQVLEADVAANSGSLVSPSLNATAEQQVSGLSAQQAPVVQVMVDGQVRDIPLTLPLGDEQLEGLNAEQIAALQTLALKEVAGASQGGESEVTASADLLASSKSETGLTEAQKAAATLTANHAVESQQQVKPTAVAAAVSAGMAVASEVDAADDGQLSWVLDQMTNSPKKSGQEGLVTGMLAEQGAKDSAKQTIVGGAGLALATNKLNTESSAAATEMLDSVDMEAIDVDMLPNEPIELRKKEHEAMLSRMAGQNPVADDAVMFNSSLNQQQAGRAIGAAGVASQLATPNQAAMNMAMSVPPGHPNWAAEMGQKVAWIARDGGHTAHIRLDPPELGSLTVKVSVDNDSNTQINFVAATPQARDLLEGQMGRLREMLAQQGVDLSRAEVDVSQQDASGAQKDPRQASLVASNDGVLEDQEDDDMSSAKMSYVTSNGVDYYA